MGLLRKIDEVFATAHYYRHLANRYAAKIAQEPESGQIIADQHAEDEQPARAA